MKERIAIIGCGLIGDSWAALMTAYGHEVTAWDPSPNVMADFEARVEKARVQVWQLMADRRSVTGSLTLATTLDEALAGVTWVQENALEKLTLKQDLYARIEASVNDDVLIASSTSSLTWSELSIGMRHPQR